MFAQRLGWRFEWVSTLGDDFNHDFGVYYPPDERATPIHNYGTLVPHGADETGISVFTRQGDALYHTYSTYARGVDMFNVAYHYLDIVPKGRDEQPGVGAMSWLRHRDSYHE